MDSNISGYLSPLGSQAPDLIIEKVNPHDDPPEVYDALLPAITEYCKINKFFNLESDNRANREDTYVDSNYFFVESSCKSTSSLKDTPKGSSPALRTTSNQGASHSSNSLPQETNVSEFFAEMKKEVSATEEEIEEIDTYVDSNYFFVESSCKSTSSLKDTPKGSSPALRTTSNQGASHSSNSLPQETNVSEFFAEMKKEVSATEEEIEEIDTYVDSNYFFVESSCKSTSSLKDTPKGSSPALRTTSNQGASHSSNSLPQETNVSEFFAEMKKEVSATEEEIEEIDTYVDSNYFFVESSCKSTSSLKDTPKGSSPALRTTSNQGASHSSNSLPQETNVSEFFAEMKKEVSATEEEIEEIDTYVDSNYFFVESSCKSTSSLKDTPKGSSPALRTTSNQGASHSSNSLSQETNVSEFFAEMKKEVSATEEEIEEIDTYVDSNYFFVESSCKSTSSLKDTPKGSSPALRTTSNQGASHSSNSLSQETNVSEFFAEMKKEVSATEEEIEEIDTYVDSNYFFVESSCKSTSSLKDTPKGSSPALRTTSNQGASHSSNSLPQETNVSEFFAEMKKEVSATEEEIEEIDTYVDSNYFFVESSCKSTSSLKDTPKGSSPALRTTSNQGASHSSNSLPQETNVSEFFAEMKKEVSATEEEIEEIDTYVDSNYFFVESSCKSTPALRTTSNQGASHSSNSLPQETNVSEFFAEMKEEVSSTEEEIEEMYTYVDSNYFFVESSCKSTSSLKDTPKGSSPALRTTSNQGASHSSNSLPQETNVSEFFAEMKKEVSATEEEIEEIDISGYMSPLGSQAPDLIIEKVNPHDDPPEVYDALLPAITEYCKINKFFNLESDNRANREESKDIESSSDRNEMNVECIEAKSDSSSEVSITSSSTRMKRKAAITNSPSIRTSVSAKRRHV